MADPAVSSQQSVAAVGNERSVIPHVLRRMRAPLLTLVTAYAIAILGLVLIPGRTPAGEAYHLSFFDAFYFISYTATTIGFGELPYGFSDTQRLWVTVSIYLVVIAWFYAIGTIVGLVRDQRFQLAVARNAFRRRVRRLTEPFYLVCGCGDTGMQLVAELTERGSRAVVIDIDEARTSELGMADLRSHVPVLCADANLSEQLLAAGLDHPYCRALLAVTGSDHTNLQIAISAKLLNPGLTVVTRADNHATRDNMASFDTDHIVNPFDTFAGGLAMAIQTPRTHRLYEWLSAKPVIPLTSGTLPPRGRWIVCGYGRLAHAIQDRLENIGVDDIAMVAPERPADFRGHAYVKGKGTEAATLTEAGAEHAAGVIAANDDDADNLSILLTARSLNPSIFLVGRQNDPANGRIFVAAQLDMIMEPSSIMALRMIRLLTTPLLPPFLRRVRQLPDETVGDHLTEMQSLCRVERAASWTLHVNSRDMPAVASALADGLTVCVSHLCHSATAPVSRLPVVVAMIRRRDDVLFPDLQTPLEEGDAVLLVGPSTAMARVSWLACHDHDLRYLITGHRPADGALLRWWQRRRGQARLPG
jgi:Trk K+ transport system NAD-binding subunit